MNQHHLEAFRKLTHEMPYGPSGFFDAEHPKTNVLFVDDEPASCSVFSRAITKQLGVSVYTAPDAEQALEVMQQHHRDVAVLLTDIRMPGHSGDWLVREVKRLWPETVCILTTAFTNVERLDCQADGFIEKPWDLKYLLQMINLSILKAA